MPRGGAKEGTGKDSLVFSLRVQRGSPSELQIQLDSGRSASGQRDVTRRGAEFPVGLGGVGVAPERGHSFPKPHPGSAPLPSSFPVPAPPAGPGIGLWAGYTSKAVSSSRQAGKASCTPSSPS